MVSNHRYLLSFTYLEQFSLWFKPKIQIINCDMPVRKLVDNLGGVLCSYRSKGSHSQLSYVCIATRPLSRCYLRLYLVKKYCRSLQRAQQEIQEQSSNTGEQATSSSELNTSIIVIKHLSHFDDLLTAGIPDSADLIKVLNIPKTTQAFTSSFEV